MFAMHSGKMYMQPSFLLWSVETVLVLTSVSLKVEPNMFYNDVVTVRQGGIYCDLVGGRGGGGAQV